ncbi:DUF523 domain-containing protein [Streptomyces sp. CCM_MD2014]|uniref:DUF523 domain-containing protein n=1 Tax=Streptomyces sp. CCM_MD2014 TaxID=1561022 RepID=UPI00052ABB2F|nr:DUF523 domain-containing protein [Streptomyces sp. CCM_MD2014]AIV38665.1 purine nucleoside phosphorylase [Streptomyces sp. CCM_MD2014]
MERILVSACLLGRPVRYDGGAKPVGDAVVGRWRDEGRVVVFCPEVSGGLPVPRPAAEIVGGDGADVLDGVARVLTEGGEDVSRHFVRGARLALEAARGAGVRVALLKESSPSCGSLRVYDGRFAGARVPGQGVTTALLRRAGVRVFSEEQIPEAVACLRELEGSGGSR